MFGGGMNFNGGQMQIDPQQMMQMQQFQQECAKHPGCDDCPLFNLNGVNGIICENAVIRLNQIDK